MTSAARTTLLLAASNLAVYGVLLAAWLASPLIPGLASVLSGWLALPASTAEIARMPWTPLSYMFTHVSFIHLLVNMLWLIGFGAVMGGSGKRTLLTYLLGGLAGAAMFAAANIFMATDGAPLAGASASVIAVVAASAVCMPSRRMSFLFISQVKVKWMSIAAVVMMLAGSIASPAAALAHMGGLLAGIACGMAVKLKMRSESYAALEQARVEARRHALIHKTRRSGFASLTEEERLELFNLAPGPSRRDTRRG